MDKKTILLINYTLTAGGAERYMSELANYLTFKGYNISILLLDKSEIFYSLNKRISLIEPDFKKGKLKIDKYIYFLKIIFYIRKHIKNTHPFCIINTAFPFFVMVSVWGMRIPVIIPIRCDPAKTSLIEGINIPLKLRQIMYKRSKVIIAQTSFAAEILSKQFKHTHVVTIPNMLSPTFKSVDFRENIIISAGKLIKSKGFDYLIKSFIKTVSDDWKLIILGEGPERQNLQNLIESHKLEDKVFLPGNKKNISEYYARSKIFAFTSLSEGFPNALLEAMATPLACISFDCDAGPRDMIIDGVNGFLVELKNINEFDLKLKILIENENLRESFMSESIKVREIFNRNKIGMQYINIIETFSK